MRLPRRLTKVALLTALLACREPAAELTPADIAAIKATYSQWGQAVVAGDLDAASKLMTPDVWFSIPNQAPILGRDAAVAWIKTWPTIISQDWVIDEVIGHRDIAYARATVTETYALTGGSAITEHQACLSVHRRQADGAWQFSHAICHSVDPLPLAP